MGSNQRGQIVMTPDEIDTFLRQRRTATLATLGPGGLPHLTAMWFAVLGDADGPGIHSELWFETKAKSQKAVNLSRDPRATALIEDGLTYDTLRGVSIEGRVEIHDDPDTCLRVGIAVWERYNGPYTDDLREAVEMMMHKRVAVRLRADRVRSWDHRKLGMPAMPLAGSTAEFYR